MDTYFTSIEDDPEAMLDLLTLKSIRERYSDSESNDPIKSHDSTLVSDQEFDDFVREFPIDDSISECFAVPEGKKGYSKQSNSKPPVSQGKHKLKKKLLSSGSSEGHVLSDEDSRSSDSKKSKLIGNIFHRKSKSKERSSREASNGPESVLNGIVSTTKLGNIPATKSNDVTSAIIDACENISNSYSKSESSASVAVQGTNRISGKANSVIPEKSQRVKKNLSGSSSSDIVSGRKLPTFPRQRKQSTSSQSGSSLENRKSKENAVAKFWSNALKKKEKPQDIIHILASWSSDKYRQTRDSRGNNVLHHCIVTDRIEVAEVLIRKSPDLALERNLDQMNAMQLSILHGHEALLEQMVEPLLRNDKISIKMVGRLISLSAEHGKSSCLQKLLRFLPIADTAHELPKNIDGATAAHIAAARGHLSCLQILVAHGYTRWEKDSRGFHPLQLAVQNGHVSCYQFMLLHECVTCLFREYEAVNLENTRFQVERMNERTCLESLEQRLLRHCGNLSTAMTNLNETQDNINHSLETVCTAMEEVVNKMDEDSAATLRVKLQDIKAERERLQDVFEFSPLVDSNEVISRIAQDFTSAIQFNTANEPSLEPRNSLYDVVQKMTEKTTDAITAGSGAPVDVTNVIRQHILSLVTPNNSTNDVIKVQSVPDSRSISRKEIREIVLIEDTNNNNIHEPIEDNDNTKDVNCVNDSDNESNETVTLQRPPFHGSVTSNTMTSGITCTSYDWNSRLSTGTSDSESDWWEDSHKYRDDDDDDDNGDEDDINDYLDDDYDDGAFSSVRLNLENEDLPDDVLRELRLTQHLKSMEKLSTERADLVETVVTATGRRIGGEERRPVIDHPSVTAQGIQDKRQLPRRKSKDRVKLFSMEDVLTSRELSQSEFLEGYGRSHSRPREEKQWDEVSSTDGEDTAENVKPWYEMSEDEESIIQMRKSDDDDTLTRNYKLSSFEFL